MHANLTKYVIAQSALRVANLWLMVENNSFKFKSG